MNKQNLIVQFSWVGMLKEQYESITQVDEEVHELSGEVSWVSEQERTMYLYLYYGCLYSVIEGLEDIKYKMKEIIPELEMKVELIVVKSIESAPVNLYNIYNTMKRCRHATFHVAKDTDKRKQSMRIAMEVLYKDQLEKVYIKTKKLIDEIKLETGYEDI